MYLNFTNLSRTDASLTNTHSKVFLKKHLYIKRARKLAFIISLRNSRRRFRRPALFSYRDRARNLARLPPDGATMTYSNAATFTFVRFVTPAVPLSASSVFLSPFRSGEFATTFLVDFFVRRVEENATLARSNGARSHRPASYRLSRFGARNRSPCVRDHRSTGMMRTHVEGVRGEIFLLI